MVVGQTVGNLIADGIQQQSLSGSSGNGASGNGSPSLLQDAENVGGAVVGGVEAAGTAIWNGLKWVGGEIGQGLSWAGSELNGAETAVGNFFNPPPATPSSTSSISLNGDTAGNSGLILAASRTYSPTQQANNLALAQSNLSDPKVQAFISLLANKESGGQYNAIVGGGSFSDYSQHPDIYVPSLNSTAAGAFQFTYGTWNDVSSALGLTDFSPASQQLGAVYLLNKLGAIAALESGNVSQAIFDAGKRWDAFPLSASGTSISGGNRPLQPLINTYKAALPAPAPMRNVS
jgi:muramidase (phage lysozyme)